MTRLDRARRGQISHKGFSPQSHRDRRAKRGWGLQNPNPDTLTPCHLATLERGSRDRPAFERDRGRNRELSMVSPEFELE